MKNILTATELKRRGMAAVEAALQSGPVHVTKRNKPVAVVLSVDDYRGLAHTNATALKGMTAAAWLLASPASGRRGKRQIDAALKNERAW